jgi:DNA repair protein RecO (recombination protein O)
MAIRHDQGIVLRTYSFGEADKVVIILSPNYGKLRTVAKGVRKTKSRFGGRLEPFTHIDLVLYEGRNLDTVTQVSVIEAYPSLRMDYEAVLAAGTMVEVTDAIAQENESSTGLFLLLQRGLEALESGANSLDLLSLFLLKAAGVLGVSPSLEFCAGCGRAPSKEEKFRFAFGSGGLVCHSCEPSGAYRLREGVVQHLASLAEADLKTVPALESGLEADALGTSKRYLEFHLEKRLTSLEVMHG